MSIDLTNLARSAILDSLGRYAKSTEKATTVRLWFAGDSPQGFTDLTFAEYQALSAADRRTINESGSAVGFVDTEGHTNA